MKKLGIIFGYLIFSLMMIFSICSIILFTDISPLQLAIPIDRSMSPTLYKGNFYLANSRVEEYKRGDIVEVAGLDDCYTIKRIIAGPGDSVEVIEGVVYVNGELDAYNSEELLERAKKFNFSLVLNDGEYFVLGDDRNNSFDCRHLENHCIREDYLISRLIYEN